MMRRWTSIVEQLIRFGANIDQQVSHGGWIDTPLRMAWRHDRFEIFEILKAVGADNRKPLYIHPYERKLWYQPVNESDILEIRFRIYFRHSLVSTLIYLL